MRDTIDVVERTDAMTTDEIRELRELANAATPGPWTVGKDIYGRYAIWFSDDGVSCSVARTERNGWLTEDGWQANDDFIAASRLAVPRLCDEVEELRRQLAAKDERIRELREALDDLVSSRVKVSEGLCRAADVLAKGGEG